MNVEWRHLTHDDVPAWNTLIANAEAVDKTGEHYDEADLHEEMDDPSTGPLDRIGGFVGSEMAASAGVRPRADASLYLRIEAEGFVDPRWRGQGLGTEGIQWTLRRAKEIQVDRNLDVPAKIHGVGYPGDPAQLDLFESEGFTAVNWSATMRAQLDTGSAPAEPTVPEGFTLLEYDESWAERTREAHNAAFADHWGFVPWDAVMWQQWVDGGKNFRSAISWGLVDDAAPDIVVGYVQSNEFVAFEEMIGRREAYLARIGVRREYRGRGLASMLLRYALWKYRDAGYVETSLDVDTNNPTGAFGLYERAGYELETRKTIYEFELPALDDVSS